MLILPERELWRPDAPEIWTPSGVGRTRRRGGFIAPDRGLRQSPLYAAMTRTSIGFVVSGTNANSYTMTMNAQPVSNKLLIGCVANTVGAGGTANIPVLSGNGLSYTTLTSVTFTNGTVGIRLTVVYALGTTTGSGSITVTYGGVTQTSCCAAVNQIDGTVITGTNGVDAIGNVVTNTNGGASHTAGSFTSSLSYGNSNNRPFVAVSDNVNASDWTALSGWTTLDAFSQNSPANNMQVFWRPDLADTTVGATHATNSTVGLIAFELVAAVAAGAVMRRTLSNIGTRTGARQGV